MTTRLVHRCVLVLLALLVGAGGCGLSENAGPQTIPAENVPKDLLSPNPSSSTTLPESGATTPVKVYFLEQVGTQTVLKAVERQVKTPEFDLPGARIAPLFAQPTPKDQDRGISTSIPANTKLLSAPLPATKGDDLVINVSSELFTVQGQELANAFAQIVWTVSEIDGISRVRFRRDGVAIPALDAEGTEKQGAVTVDDYRSLAPRD